MFHNCTYSKDHYKCANHFKFESNKVVASFANQSRPRGKKLLNSIKRSTKTVQRAQSSDFQQAIIIIKVCKILYYYFVCSHRVRPVHRPRGVIRQVSITIWLRLCACVCRSVPIYKSACILYYYYSAVIRSAIIISALVFLMQCVMAKYFLRITMNKIKCRTSVGSRL